MQRTPVSESAATTPAYPARSAKWSRTFAWARRVGAAVSASALLTVTACYGSTTPETFVEPENDAGVVDSGEPPVDAGQLIDGEPTIDSAVHDASTTGDATITIDATVVDAAPTIPVVEFCEPDHRDSGDSPVPEYMFACGAERPADTPIHSIPFWGSGRTCGAPGDWMSVEITEPQRIAVSFPSGVGGLSAQIYGPDGALVGEIDQDQPCLQFDAHAGLWSVAVRGGEICESPAYFELAVDPMYEE